MSQYDTWQYCMHFQNTCLAQFIPKLGIRPGWVTDSRIWYGTSSTATSMVSTTAVIWGCPVHPYRPMLINCAEFCTSSLSLSLPITNAPPSCWANHNEAAEFDTNISLVSVEYNMTALDRSGAVDFLPLSHSMLKGGLLAGSFAEAFSIESRSRYHIPSSHWANQERSKTSAYPHWLNLLWLLIQNKSNKEVLLRPCDSSTEANESYLVSSSSGIKSFLLSAKP